MPPITPASTELEDNIHTLAQIEAQLVALLTTALTPAGAAHPVVPVEALPSMAAGYRLGAAGGVLVAYQGSNPRGDGHATYQEVEHQFEVLVVSRTLRAPQTGAGMGAGVGAGAWGSYELLELCRTAALGARLDSSTGRCLMGAVRFEQCDADGLWHYSMQLRVPGLWQAQSSCME